MYNHDLALVTAVAETLRDPAKFKSLLVQAAYLAGGYVEGFTVEQRRDPVTVRSARYCHPDDNITVAWDCTATLSFRTRNAVKKVDP
jgi:hypothetical protein